MHWVKSPSLTLNLSFFTYKMDTLIIPVFSSPKPVADCKKECTQDAICQEVTLCACKFFWRPRLLLTAA